MADVCCGTGSFGLQALLHGKNVVFVDSDKWQLDVLVDRLKFFSTFARPLIDGVITCPEKYMHLHVDDYELPLHQQRLMPPRWMFLHEPPSLEETIQYAPLLSTDLREVMEVNQEMRRIWSSNYSLRVSSNFKSHCGKKFYMI